MRWFLSPATTAKRNWQGEGPATGHEGKVTMRAQHPTTADEIDVIVHRQGSPKIRRTVKRSSARRDRRTARRTLRT